MTRWSKKK